jgi:hypothetical protein
VEELGVSMPIIDIFSKRRKKEKGEIPDVYTYSDLPEKLRVQIIHIIKGALGDATDYRSRTSVSNIYNFIVNSLCREYGLFRLPSPSQQTDVESFLSLFNFILIEKDIEKVFDAVELSFRAIDHITRNYNYLSRVDASHIADDALTELNARFIEQGVGYCYVNGNIIKINSQFIHSEVVIPALKLISDKKYLGVQDEFLSAHKHYREGNKKDTINDCLKAFESMMKVICKKRGWKYEENAVAKELINILFENNFIPPFWQSYYAALRSLLECGVPTGRNKLSAHGQGEIPLRVPDPIVAYILHMTAASIVFLGEADNEFK